MRHEANMRLGLASERGHMKGIIWLLGTSAFTLGCMDGEENRTPLRMSRFTVAVEQFATVNVIGPDTLSDSARIIALYPEPDGGSVTFRFTDPAKHITSGLGIVQASGARQAQLVWPDSVLSVWWGSPHQLGFTAGTGTGVWIVVDVHANQLEAIVTSDSGRRPARSKSVLAPQSAALAMTRAQAFIDSVRVQPDGTPQRSTLRYRADTAAVAPDTALAAVHVSANDHQGKKSNPAWYLVHIPSGHVHPVDSLTGSSPGLPATAGQWNAEGLFYYAKERSILRAQPQIQ